MQKREPKMYKTLLHTRRILLLGIAATCGLFLFLLASLGNENKSSNNFLTRKGFLVDTPGCQIPDTDPFDKSVRHMIIKTQSLQCDGIPPLTYVDGEWLRINKTAQELQFQEALDYCEYQAILRPDPESSQPDNHFSYNKTAVKFKTDVKMACAFVRIACYGVEGSMIYSTFHAFILRNKTLEMKLNALQKDFTDMHQPKETMNVIFLGVDAVSRLNFIRQMPQTRRLLIKKLNAIELKGYNKVADNTFVNLVPMFAGKYAEELGWEESKSDQSFDRYQFLWKNFSSIGYRTFFAEDAPTISIFNYAKEGFHEEPMDYYLRPFSLALEEHGSMWNQDHDCVGAKPETQVVLDYLKEFVTTMKEDPYFALTFITRLTHDNINKAGLGDELYYKFFLWLHENKYLDNTIVFFFSDHGIRFGPIRETYIGKLEERLPFAYLLFPNWFSQKYGDMWHNLRLNENRLSTPFDIFETMKDILNFKGYSPKASMSSRGMSLFSEIPVERTCDDASILPHWCTCHQKKQVNTNEKSVISASNAIVEFINSQLHNHGKTPCAKLSLDKITDALKLVSNDQVLTFKESLHNVVKFGQKSKAIVDYLITVQTVPGYGLFEATVRHSTSDDAFNVIGDISRINRYGNQAVCINSDVLRKFCYCL